ncbi:hypothetical protein CYK05_06765 [Rothia mucilaginosa]|nr:hypothetical protein CYK05_06765 [Rothia mucilaginosa]
MLGNSKPKINLTTYEVYMIIILNKSKVFFIIRKNLLSKKVKKGRIPHLFFKIFLLFLLANTIFCDKIPGKVPRLPF